MKNAVVYLEDKKIKEIYVKLAKDMKNRRKKKSKNIRLDGRSKQWKSRNRGLRK